MVLACPLATATVWADDDSPPGPPPGEWGDRRPPQVEKGRDKDDASPKEARRIDVRRRRPGRSDGQVEVEIERHIDGPRGEGSTFELRREALPSPEEIEQIVRSAIREAISRRVGRGPEGGPFPPPPPGGPGARIFFGPSKELRELHEQDFKLEQEAVQLGDRYRKTKEASEKERLKGELKSLVEKHFEVRQKRRTLELEQLEKQLTQLKSSIESRQKNRQSLIDKRVGELTGEDDSGF
jgi:hypothetical protein